MKLLKVVPFAAITLAGFAMPTLAQDAAAPQHAAEQTAEAKRNHDEGRSHRRGHEGREGYFRDKRMTRYGKPYSMLYRGLFDLDGDGKITGAELDEKLASLIEAHDADKDGELSLEEFATLHAEVMRPMMVRNFQRLDRDGDGQISETEQQVVKNKLSRFTMEKEGR